MDAVDSQVSESRSFDKLSAGSGAPGFLGWFGAKDISG
jgi:hypothetical protein